MNHGRPDLAALVARWHGTAGTLAHVRNGDNTVYEFQVEGSRLFLRLTDDRHRSRGQLEAELDFVRFVASRGVRAACPLLSDRGDWVETLHTDDDTGDWHAVVFADAPGRHFRFFSSDIDRPLFQAWGSAMGALHVASREFIPVESRRRPSWAEQRSTRCDLSGLPAAETEARREHARITEWLASPHTTADSWGLIHGDFERTNFVFDGSTLTAFDFDDACYHWYLADISHALWAFRGAPPADRKRFLQWFLDGYRERCSVSVDVREHLSWFVRLRSLSLFLNHLHTSAASGGSSADDKWERRLRAEFEEPFVW